MSSTRRRSRDADDKEEAVAVHHRCLSRIVCIIILVCSLLSCVVLWLWPPLLLLLKCRYGGISTLTGALHHFHPFTMLDLHAAPPATVTRLLLVIIFSTCLATHTAAFASSKTVLSSPVITAVGRQQYTSLHRHTIETSKNNHLRLRRDGLAMSSATTAMAAIPIADSAFWIGFYGLLQVTLWIKIMTIRSVQSQSTH